MAKVTTVLLQGVSYHWNGQDILVDDGINMPWPLPGSALEQVELFDGEGEPLAAFSIDFSAQQWSLLGPGGADEVILLDERGDRLLSPMEDETHDILLQEEPLLPPSELAMTDNTVNELVLPDIDDILDEVVELEEIPPATGPDTAGLNSEIIDDVINWLAVYHHHD
ncbi:hypothetical protein [Zobellella sp. DQSA1]|uniref:hypothetical protein n=1 Tax=Zobellella sp. DQSA1 TaxID=3342386 RepID=UPI0035BFB15A